MKNRKPVKLTLKISIPTGADRAQLNSDGSVHIVDKNGTILTPPEMERAATFPRTRSRRGTHSQSTVTDGYLTPYGLDELTKYDAVFIIDTNTRIINNKKCSLACFLDLKFNLDGDVVRMESKGQKLNYFEFWDVPDGKNPEMLAILHLVNGIVSSPNYDQSENICFITDSELGDHKDINTGVTPLYNSSYLPKGFELQYANADSGSAIMNKLIKFCEKQSSVYLKRLENNDIASSKLYPLSEEPSIMFRYIFDDTLEIIDPEIKRLRVEEGTKIHFYAEP